MNVKYLAVDSDVALAESEAAGWAKRNIGMDRVDNMTEGIKMLQSNDYLYVGINGSAVDFMPLLRAMRSVTDTPVLIATRDFCTDKEVAALRAGANLFAKYHETTEGNIDSVLAHIMRITEENKTPRKVLIYKELLIAPAIHEVFINNTEVMLTKKEFDILRYLVENHGVSLMYSQIIERVWGIENANPDVLWTHVKRIRQKLSEASPDYENCIENIHGVGYKLTE